MKRDLISMLDVKDDVEEIIDLGIKLKQKSKKGESIELLKGKTLGIIFEKSSTRTRVSFEVGMTKLGGHAIFLSTNDIQLGRGETIEDTAIVLSRYCDILMYRAKSNKAMKELANGSTVPVISGLDDKEHPCQIVTDLMTIKEHKGKLKGLNFVYLGDEVEGATVGADVVATDTWVSMGDESEKEKRIKEFKGYTIDEKLMSKAKKDAIFMHCLPAYYGYEVTKEVAHGSQSVIFDEAENRLWAQIGIMVTLCK